MAGFWRSGAEEQERLLLQQLEAIALLNKGETSKKENASAASGVSSEDSKPKSLAKIIRKDLVVTRSDLEAQFKDPKSPLYHVKSFEELRLKPQLLKGLYDMGYYSPSKVQETTLPALLADPPVGLIAQSQSGTGKTAAFVLAMLSRVDTSLNHPQVVCLSPTYELAIQTGEISNRMAKFWPELKFEYAVRGEQRARDVKLTEHVIIGTPGTTFDWAFKFKLFDISKIVVFVLDEADVMLSKQGHYEQVHRMAQRLHPRCQKVLFSATFDKTVMEFAESIIWNPLILRLRQDEECLDNVKQYYVHCRNEEEKYQAITNIYGVIAIGQAIIFCQSKRAAKWLAQKMVRDGHAVGMLSSELTVEDRLAVLDRFRAGKEKVLITTNVLSRGIDIEQVTIVVNFHLPLDQHGNPEFETYLHRIGRTGRFGSHGLAINLIQDKKDWEVIKTIQKHFSKPIMPLNVEDVDEIEKIQD